MIDSYFRTGIPSSSPVKSLLRIAVWIFSKLKAVVTPWSLPEPMIHLRQPPYRLPFFESGTYGIDLGSPFAAESGEPMRIRVELVGGRCTHLELRVP